MRKAFATISKLLYFPIFKMLEIIMSGAASSENLSSVMAILSRVLDAGNKPMSVAAARFFAKATFSALDKARMTDLAMRNQCGGMSRAEIAELEDYARANILLGILQSRARKTLKKEPSKFSNSR